MLVITRKRGEKVQIGPDIEVMVTKVSDGQVRLAIKAPETTKIVRTELQSIPASAGSSVSSNE